MLLVIFCHIRGRYELVTLGGSKVFQKNDKCEKYLLFVLIFILKFVSIHDLYFFPHGKM